MKLEPTLLHLRDVAKRLPIRGPHCTFCHAAAVDETGAVRGAHGTSCEAVRAVAKKELESFVAFGYVVSIVGAQPARLDADKTAKPLSEIRAEAPVDEHGYAGPSTTPVEWRGTDGRKVPLGPEGRG